MEENTAIKEKGLRDGLLNDCLYAAAENGDEYTVFTTNGFRMIGTISAYSENAILLETKDGRKLVMLHAISTIVSPNAAPVF